MTLSLTADLQEPDHAVPVRRDARLHAVRCIASAGLKAVSDYRLLGFVPLKSLYDASDAVGKRVGRLLGGA